MAMNSPYQPRWTGKAEVWQLVVVQAVYGTAEAFFTPSVAGLVPQVVESDRLQEANSLLRMTFSASLRTGATIETSIAAES